MLGQLFFELDTQLQPSGRKGHEYNAISMAIQFQSNSQKLHKILYLKHRVVDIDLIEHTQNSFSKFLPTFSHSDQIILCFSGKIFYYE